MQNKKQKNWSFGGLIWAGLLWATRLLAVQATVRCEDYNIFDSASNKTLLPYTPYDGGGQYAQSLMLHCSTPVPITQPSTLSCDLMVDKNYLPDDCVDQVYMGLKTTAGSTDITYHSTDCCSQSVKLSGNGSSSTIRVQIGSKDGDKNTCNLSLGKTSSLYLNLSPSFKPCVRPDKTAYVPIVKVGECTFVDSSTNTPENTICYTP